MKRIVVLVVLVVIAFCTPSAARADELAWAPIDAAELQRLAKKAKKNGEFFTVTGKTFEARLPTREAAAEFCLYFERLAERVSPLWGTRENTTKLVNVAMHPKDAAWPADHSGRKIRFEAQKSKQSPETAIQIASMHVWIHPELTGDALAVASVPRADMNRVGIEALTSRLAGLNPRPGWFDAGMIGAFAAWNPAASADDPAARLDANARSADGMRQMEDRLAAPEAVDVLIAWFVPPKKPVDRTAADAIVFESFFAFLVEDDRGRKLFVETAQSLSRGKPVEIEKKQITKLVPAWRAWAGLPPAKDTERD